MARKDRINMSRREYHICINLNDIFITKVVIDSHYEAKHNESINDEIILNLVQRLDGKFFEAIDNKPPYCYFLTYVSLNNKRFKIIWLLEEDDVYIGIINVHRS